MRKASVLALSSLLALTLAAGAARASHYAVSDVPRLVPAGDVDKLHKAGVETTEQEPGRRRAVHLHVRGLDTGARQRGAALLSGILTRHCLPPDAEGEREDDQLASHRNLR